MPYKDNIELVVTDKHTNSIKYIEKLIYIYLLLYYIIALSLILSTLQIRPQLVKHYPIKWDSDNDKLL